jgi:hypothetical protein
MVRLSGLLLRLLYKAASLLGWEHPLLTRGAQAQPDAPAVLPWAAVVDTNETEVNSDFICDYFKLHYT